MTALEIFWHQVDLARQTGDDTDLIFRRYIRAKAFEPKKRPKMPAFHTPRTHLMQLNNRHLDVIRDYGCEDIYDRREVETYFMANYNKLFGSIRSKAKEVPSDEIRRSLLVTQLLNLIELRREENAAGAWPNELPEYR